jgi:UrcA family protein
MKNNDPRIAGTKIALFALGSFLVGSAAFAEEIAQVTVTASRPTAKIVGYTIRGGSIEEVALSYKVSYADLDVATHSGAATFESRINEAAKKACAELDKEYPLAAPGGKSCEKSAVDAAMPKVHSIIAAAEKSAHAK